MLAQGQILTPVAAAVDHLLLGVSDLNHGIAWVEQRTGVRAQAGGSHPGAGTRNALLSLGRTHYLEIIAPDPAQSAFNFQIDIRGLKEPRLITFAVVTNDIEGMAAIARKAGYQVFGPRTGSRQTLSGHMLRWKSMGVLNKLGSGGVEPVPFFIQWDAGVPHPSKTSPGGCEFEGLEFQHHDPAALRAALGTFGFEGKVSQAAPARIMAAVKTPKGRIVLG